MGCKINSTKMPTLLFSSYPKNSIQRVNSISVCSSYIQDQNTTSVNQVQQPKPQIYSVKFKTMRACKLGISKYPNFVYDAEGGTGTGTGNFAGTEDSDLSKEIYVSFDLQTLYIPPLNSATTRFLGLPLPSFLKIDIVPELFQGTIDEETGKVALEFKAKFCFSVGTVYRAPPLVVETVLTSEESSGGMRCGKGERLGKEGKCRLVGVATVDPIDDRFMNSFLGLPTECLADLNATIQLSAFS